MKLSQYCLIVTCVLAIGIQVAQCITAADKQLILDEHNAARRRMPAQTMPDLVWDDDLATVASTYSANCNWQHNSARTADYAALGHTGYVGENLAMSYGSGAFPTTTRTASGWYGEEADWTYPMTCASGKVCGHWTQIIWADTTKVGCEVQTSCTSMTNDPFTPGIPAGSKIKFIVCNYWTGGNYNGQAPYQVRTTAPTGPAPVSTGPAPVSTGPAPVSTGPAPVSTGPAPVSTGPAPVSTGPAPTTSTTPTGPAPITSTVPSSAPSAPSAPSAITAPSGQASSLAVPFLFVLVVAFAAFFL